ncbi:MAG TPA: short-chain fatty acyl-CoA regulator family protein [Geminicoccaceae bacterium]|nr:short-chain fatty acyl-CoA regulator family protein [Geminicoccaceae bacterium]
MDKKAMLGHKVRRLRQAQGLTQAEMAEQIGISPSYLNLIERNQRPVTVPMLFRLGQAFEVDLRDFAEDEEARLAAGLSEVFGDALFEGQDLKQQDIRELASASPAAAQAVLTLYKAYRDLWEDAQALAHRVGGGDDRPQQQAGDGHAFAIEEVRDFQEAHSNHFPEVEEAALELRAAALPTAAAGDDPYPALAAYLGEAHGLGVRVMPVSVMQDTERRYDMHRRRVLLSEALPRSTRTFQLAAQVALLTRRELLDRIVAGANLQGDTARRLLRVGLAGYFAAAVMMPYGPFLEAARELRHDLALLQRRFGASFEQVCHRLTTLQRQGERGVPFFFIRIDKAGNVSKRYSGGGFPFARFGGPCPRWVIHDAFASPGLIRTQIAEMPDGTAFFTIARTLDPSAGWHRPQSPHFAIGLGCALKDAKHLVYADGLDPKSPQAREPIGVSGRVCERLDCAQRAHPPLNHRLRVDEHVRRATPFTFAG